MCTLCICQHNKLLSLIYKYHNDRHFRKMFARDLLFTTQGIFFYVVVVENTHVPDILLSFVCLGFIVKCIYQQERFIYLLCTRRCCSGFLLRNIFFLVFFCADESNNLNNFFLFFLFEINFLFIYFNHQHFPLVFFAFIVNKLGVKKKTTVTDKICCIVM